MWVSLFFHSLPRDVTFVVLSAVWAGPHGALGVAWAYVASRVLCLAATVIIASVVRSSRAVRHSQNVYSLDGRAS
jgi:hypothetical protein